MKMAIVTFDNKDVITTSINGTDEEIREYYKIGKVFNLGYNGNDFMATVVSVEIPTQEEDNRISKPKPRPGAGVH